MPNIVEYVLWRGDLTFEESPINKIDNLVFCHLTYADMTSVFAENESITIEELWKRLGGNAQFKLLTSGDEDIRLLEACAKSRRFGKLKMTDYEDNIEIENNKQFAAVTYHLNDEEVFIAYRGTDDTIVGWKEDCMLSYCKVPAQEHALDYAKKVIAKNSKCYIGGHSKGGNLALFAAAFLDKDELLKVKKVFLNDSPGFCKEVIETKYIEMIDDKCIRITPEFCIVGAIFEPRISESYIVKSDASQMLQHNMLSWQVKGTSLETSENHDAFANTVNDMLAKFIDKMDNLEDREAFVGAIFDTMGENGAVTIADFMGKGPNAIENLLVKVIGENKEGVNPLKRVKQNISNDIKNTSMGKAWSEESDKKAAIRIILSIVVSVLCYLIPKSFIEVTVAITIFLGMAYQLVQTCYHLFESKFDFAKEKVRINISIALVVIYTILIVKDHALFLVSTILLGVFFLMSSYNCALKIKECGQNRLAKARYIFETILSAMCGVYSIASSSVSLNWYTMSVGSYIFIDAIFEMIRLYRKRKRDKGGF